MSSFVKKNINYNDLYDNIKQNNYDVTIRILVGIFQEDNLKYSTDLVYAKLTLISEKSIKLTSYKEIDGNIVGFDCTFPRHVFFIERFDFINKRIDAQIRNNFEFSEYQDSWINKNTVTSYN